MIEERQMEESYSKRMLDFVKWVSSIAVAAILWIGNDIASITGWPQILAIIDLVILILSLEFAIFAAAKILTASGKYWDIIQQITRVTIR